MHAGGCDLRSFAKFNYVRSPKLLQACRELSCQNCGAQDGTVVAAHSNESRHGKGRSIKASDIYVASLCHRCHMELDQGLRMSRSERLELWLAAHVCTVKELLRRGLWPPDAPVPDIESYQF